MSYGAAYYPWINTTILKDRDLDYSVSTTATP